MMNLSRLTVFGLLALLCSALVSCSHFRKEKKVLYAEDIPPRSVVRDGVAVTLSDQKLTVFQGGKKV